MTSSDWLLEDPQREIRTKAVRHSTTTNTFVVEFFENSKLVIRGAGQTQALALAHAMGVIVAKGVKSSYDKQRRG